jgi:N utilization substance protein B
MQTKHEPSVQPKNAVNRRQARARAFQVIYGLFFNQADSVRALGRLYNRSLYAEPLAASVHDSEFSFDEPDPAEQAEQVKPGDKADKYKSEQSVPSMTRKTGQFVPDLRDLDSGEESEQIFTPEASKFGEAAQPEGFAWELVLGVWSKRQELDKLIERFSQNWRLDRMGRVELALLRLAVYELIFRDDVPAKVVINEALELSRSFGDENSRGFVNGILDAASKAVESGEIKRGSTFWGN